MTEGHIVLGFLLLNMLGLTLAVVLSWRKP